MNTSSYYETQAYVQDYMHHYGGSLFVLDMLFHLYDLGPPMSEK